MWRVNSRKRIFFIGLTSTEVLIINVSWACSIHHGSVAIHLPRVVEDRWRGKSMGSRTGECSMLFGARIAF
jgi:hypothetical protein